MRKISKTDLPPKKPPSIPLGNRGADAKYRHMRKIYIQQLEAQQHPNNNHN